jgi:hypothetical protein
MAIRPLLIGLTLVVALVLIILSILLVDRSRPVMDPGAFAPPQPGLNSKQ